LKKATAALVAAEAADDLNDDAQAEPLLAAIGQTGSLDDVPSLKMALYALQAKRTAKRGDLEMALDQYEQAIQELERLRGRLMVEYRVAFLEDKQRLYEEAVWLSLELDRPERALRYAERAKSRALQDLLSLHLDPQVATRSPEDQPLLDRLAQLQVERDRLYRQNVTDRVDADRGSPAVERDLPVAYQPLLVVEQAITDIWHELLRRDADYAREAALWQLPAEPALPTLGAGTILLEYFVARNTLIAFVVSAGRVTFKRLPVDLAELRQGLSQLQLHLRPVAGAAQPGALLRSGQGLLRRLHDRLVLPVLAELADARALIIVPHSFLHYVPFHALFDGERYLIERYEISYLPSAGTLANLRRPGVPAAGLVALGHSYGGRLPETIAEARAVAEEWGGVALIEEQATLAALRPMLATAQILHFATHGDFRADNPLFSGLALADGWLTTLNIFNLRLSASLVTLSACQTGRNVVGGGDELLGLMRAFFYAGARSLVVSQWAIEDRSTARFMEAFYHKLRSGLSKGAALQQTQRQFIDGQDGRDLAHFYHWAPFYLVGEAGTL
ncbi:MAG: CHAT domain-containing protein, partial [Anaerolineales bacterium]